MATVLESLAERELGNTRWKLPVLTQVSKRKLDAEYGGTEEFVRALEKAINSNRWDEVEGAVSDVILNLLDNTSEAQMFAVTPKKKLQRERFVLGGGIDLLMRLFKPPFLRHSDARRIPPSEIRQKSETWNEILVILREVAFAIPTLSDRICNSEQMVFFFTMLQHQPIFDNTMNLLEEILATREDTFQLSLIPDFYGLIGKFSARQLAHFCRVLSLVLFEPEDRHVMEGAHNLHSTELLQLRRNRVVRTCGGVVERNQSLIIDMPGLLGRFVHIMRVINFGPSLADMMSHNIVPQMPITSDVLTFFSSALGISDWDHFVNLEEIVRENRPEAGATGPRSPRTPGARDVDLSALEDEDITAELLSSFSPTPGAGGANQAMDLSSIVNVMQVARNLGIADMTPLGEALLGAQMPGNRAQSAEARRRHGTDGSRGAHPLLDIGPGRAKKELQFHSMLLSPHQIELIFVLCTLLSGRRKIAVQTMFAEAGLDAELLRMFDRMSWGVASRPIPGAPAHLHGPDCECDSAESPLRVQYLRLIHNFYDRDFLGNHNKLLMLSPAEKRYVTDERVDAPLDTALTPESGILCKTIHTLMKEPSESLYKFWLSACLENFLRGCGRMGQSLVARYGALEHTVQHVMSHYADNSVSLQTSFDLLGEIVKCNHTVLAQLDAMLSEEDFEKFRSVVLKNLIDSNVFLRSMYLSVDMITFSYGVSEQDSLTYPHPTAGLSQFGFCLNSLNGAASGEGTSGRASYLRDTWVQFEPTVLSTRAVQTPQSGTKAPAQKGKSTRSSRASSTKSPGRDGSQPSRSADHSEEPSPGSTLSAIGSGVLGALKDIRKATKHFLNFGDSVQSPQTTRKVLPEVRNSLDAEVRMSLDGAELAWDGEYFDCRASPPSGDTDPAMRAAFTPTKEPASKMPRSTYSEEMARDIQEVLLAGSPAKPTSHSVAPAQVQAQSPPATTAGREEEKMDEDTESTNVRTSSAAVQVRDLTAAVQVLSTAPPPAAPENLSRLATFLQEEKTHVLVRLMSTVSLNTINHENICCLNTALMLLLLDHKRARLGETLAAVRAVADQELAVARTRKAAGEDVDGKFSVGSLLLSRSSERTPACCAGCAKSRGSAEGSETTAGENEDAGFVLCGVCAPTAPAVGDATPDSSTVDKDTSASPNTTGEETEEAADTLYTTHSGSEVVCRNFRELLWYWQEYYLRRGRDRLSVEFSSHIPFRYWNSVVGLMCRDNGDATSLLAHPLTLPPSPYSRPTPGHHFAMPVDQNVVHNL